MTFMASSLLAEALPQSEERLQVLDRVKIARVGLAKMAEHPASQVAAAKEVEATNEANDVAERVVEEIGAARSAEATTPSFLQAAVRAGIAAKQAELQAAVVAWCVAAEAAVARSEARSLEVSTNFLLGAVQLLILLSARVGHG
jgi:hypothetical protein